MTPQIGRPDGTVDYDKINEIASSPIPERVTRGLGTSVASAQPTPSYRTDLGGLGAPGSLWLQPLRPRGKGVLGWRIPTWYIARRGSPFFQRTRGVT